jgi:hypothetical protein
MADLVPGSQDQDYSGVKRDDLVGQWVSVLGDGIGGIHCELISGSDLGIVTDARMSDRPEMSVKPEHDKEFLFFLAKNGYDVPFQLGLIKIKLNAPLSVWNGVELRRELAVHVNPAPNGTFYVPAPEDWRKALRRPGAVRGRLLPEEGALFTKILQDRCDTAVADYDQAIKSGVSEAMARLFLLGFAVYYTGVAAGHVLAWMNFCWSVRSGDQWETQAYARAIYQQVLKPAFPWTCEAWETYRTKPNFLDEDLENR